MSLRFLYALVRAGIARGDLPDADYRFVPMHKGGPWRACVKGASLTAPQCALLQAMINRAAGAYSPP